MSIFNDSAVNIPENPLAELVGEGKKYATADDLAKAKYHADLAIEDRNRELQELREELARRKTAEELVAEMRTSKDTEQPPVHTPQANKPGGVPEEDLVDRIREVTRQERDTLQMQANVAKVTEAMQKEFGSDEKANQFVVNKARELGVGVEFLQDLASRHPKAFFSTIGLSTTSTSQPGASRSDVNSLALSQSTPAAQGNAFYEQIRKTNPDLYFSMKVQRELFEDRKRMGDAFWN